MKFIFCIITSLVLISGCQTRPTKQNTHLTYKYLSGGPVDIELILNEKSLGSGEEAKNKLMQELSKLPNGSIVCFTDPGFSSLESTILGGGSRGSSGSVSDIYSLPIPFPELKDLIEKKNLELIFKR